MKQSFFDIPFAQVDMKLQREGIEALGGFLFYSWRFVVLYTRVYTQKVWTVYEMACFLCVHPDGCLVWLPVNFPPVVIAGSIVVFVTDLIMHVLQLSSVVEMLNFPHWLFIAVQFPTVFAFTVMLRKVAVDQAQSEADLQHFSIKEAICAVESDRPIVEANVVYLMRTLKVVSPDGTSGDALACFDRLVQENMPRVIRASIGRAGSEVRGCDRDCTVQDCLSCLTQSVVIFMQVTVLL